MAQASLILESSYIWGTRIGTRRLADTKIRQVWDSSAWSNASRFTASGKHRSIDDPSIHRPHKLGMWNAIEIVAEIRIYNPPMASVDQLMDHIGSSTDIAAV